MYLNNLTTNNNCFYRLSRHITRAEVYERLNWKNNEKNNIVEEDSDNVFMCIKRTADASRPFTIDLQLNQAKTSAATWWRRGSMLLLLAEHVCSIVLIYFTLLSKLNLVIIYYKHEWFQSGFATHVTNDNILYQREGNLVENKTH